MYQQNLLCYYQDYLFAVVAGCFYLKYYLRIRGSLLSSDTFLLHQLLRALWISNCIYSFVTSYQVTASCRFRLSVNSCSLSSTCWCFTSRCVYTCTSSVLSSSTTCVSCTSCLGSCSTSVLCSRTSLTRSL